MTPLSRRDFLAASLTTLASGSVFGADSIVPSDTRSERFDPDTLFLTWQRDPTTTMTVQWVGNVDETSDTNIYYSESQPSEVDLWQTQATTTKRYPLTDLRVFRAELSGLRPGRDYRFRIGKSSPTYRFRTMPAKATDTIHFISGGDCGVNAHTIANNIQAAKQDPMFAVIGGDLGYDNGRYVETSLAFLRNYSKHMIGRGNRLIPLVTCIGNHEVDGGYNKPREKAPFFFALFDGLFRNKSYATLDFGDYLSLVLLDTGHTAPIAGAQTDWLEQKLKARIDHPDVFVVNHVPAYPSYRRMDSPKGTGQGNRTHWVPLFQKYRVPVVLEHHDHTFKRSKPLLDGLAHKNGVLYLGDGSWGRLRPPQTPEQLPHLAVTSKSYHLSLHRIQGEERFHMALDESGKVMDVCRSGQRKIGGVPVPNEIDLLEILRRG